MFVVWSKGAAPDVRGKTCSPAWCVERQGFGALARDCVPCAWLDPVVPVLCCAHSPVQVSTTVTSQRPHFEKEEEEAEIESFQNSGALVCTASVCSWFTPQIGVRSDGICWRTRHLEHMTVASGIEEAPQG